MNKLFEKLSQLSYPMVFFIATSITLISVLPLWLYITNQQTRFVTKAVETIPESTVKPSPESGPVPANPPTITRVYPWVGKTGDVIIIEGRNFGNYPKNRRLAVGDVVLKDDAIPVWSDTQIEALIPKNPKQGGSVAIRIDTYPIAESLPLTFYDETATVRLHKNGNDITVTGLSNVFNASLWTQNGKRDATGIGNTQTPVSLFSLAPSEEIYSILLMNDQGTVAPYSFNPTEFGF